MFNDPRAEKLVNGYSESKDSNYLSSIRSIDFGQKYVGLSIIERADRHVVYKAKNNRPGSLFSIFAWTGAQLKDETARQKFATKAQALLALNHQNLVAIYDWGIADGSIPFLVTDYIKDKNLKRLLRNEVFFDQNSVVDIYLQVTDALAYLHTNNVIHNALSANKILIRKNHLGALVPKVIPFAFEPDVLQFSLQTDGGACVTGVSGNYLYMSPEQCLGAMPDERSNIFSLGCLMYHCLTGSAPAASRHPSRVLVKQIYKLPPPLRARFPSIDVSDELQDIVMRCLQKQAVDRYQSMNELYLDLERSQQVE